MATTITRPTKLDKPFTRQSKLANHLARNPVRRIRPGRERLRQIPHGHGITFQHTAFDQFGPLPIPRTTASATPMAATPWAKTGLGVACAAAKATITASKR